MSQDPLTPTSLTLNVTHLNNILTDVSFIKLTIELKVYIVKIIYEKFQTNSKLFESLMIIDVINNLIFNYSFFGIVVL
jgi:hypothetical protein